MKTIYRSFWGGLFGNPINRNLFFITVVALFVAIFLVIATVLLINQW